MTSQALDLKDAEIVLVEVGSDDFIPTQDELEDLSELFRTALDEAESSYKAILVLPRRINAKARGLKIQEAIDLAKQETAWADQTSAKVE